MCGDIAKKREEQQEDAILPEIYEMGVSVDKEELIKALKYDRNQYERGYRGGLAEHRWIPVNERLPEKVGTYLVQGHWANKPYEVRVCEFTYSRKLRGWANDAKARC